MKRQLFTGVTLLTIIGLLAIVPAGIIFTADVVLQTTPTAAAFLPFIAGPEPTPTPVPGPAWLGYVNRFRDMAGLPALTETAAWSYGGELHSRYMVKNDAIIHGENSGNPWYTVEGDQAGRNGNIYATGWMPAPEEAAIDWWMTAPFHAVAIVDPELQATGLGSYREDTGTYKMGATIDVSRGRGSLPGGTSFPLMFPRDGGSTWLTGFGGFEWPDPLTSCPGYSAPTGPAILIQLGSGNSTPSVSASSLSTGATPLAHCVFDETSYTNPDPGSQNSGRVVLGIRDAVVILPRERLDVGNVYTASITANGNTHTWSFTVVPATGAGLASLPPGTIVEVR
jgi:uncharacterized protein YkwD